MPGQFESSKGSAPRAHMSEALDPRPEARLLGEIPGLDAGT